MYVELLLLLFTFPFFGVPIYIIVMPYFRHFSSFVPKNKHFYAFCYFYVLMTQRYNNGLTPTRIQPILFRIIYKWKN